MWSDMSYSLKNGLGIICLNIFLLFNYFAFVESIFRVHIDILLTTWKLSILKNCNLYFSQIINDSKRKKQGLPASGQSENKKKQKKTFKKKLSIDGTAAASGDSGQSERKAGKGKKRKLTDAGKGGSEGGGGKEEAGGKRKKFESAQTIQLKYKKKWQGQKGRRHPGKKGGVKPGA